MKFIKVIAVAVSLVMCASIVHAKNVENADKVISEKIAIEIKNRVVPVEGTPEEKLNAYQYNSQVHAVMCEFHSRVSTEYVQWSMARLITFKPSSFEAFVRKVLEGHYEFTN